MISVYFYIHTYKMEYYYTQIIEVMPFFLILQYKHYNQWKGLKRESVLVSNRVFIGFEVKFHNIFNSS